MKRETLTGYFIINSHGATMPGSLDLIRHQDGVWTDLDNNHIVAQENDDPNHPVVIECEDPKKAPFIPDAGECFRVGLDVQWL